MSGGWQKYVMRMVGEWLEDASRMPGGYQEVEDIRRMLEQGQENVRMMSGGYREDVKRMAGGSQEDHRIISGGYQENVRKMYGGCMSVDNYKENFTPLNKCSFS